jgi:hypothetical protein
MSNWSYWFKDSIVTENESWSGTGNITLDIKYMFVGFLQGFFSGQTRYKWSSNIQNTKTIIADKNAIDIGVVERRPSIILSRGNLGWAYATRGQGSLGLSPKVSQTVGELGMASSEDSTLTDLIQGSLTINCIAKYGLQAEELANLVFFALSGNKQKFFDRGLHSLTGLAIGEESILRSNSDIELTAVPVSLTYSMIRDVYTSFRTKDLILTYDSVSFPSVDWYEGSSFNVNVSGTQVSTYDAPATGDTLTGTYVEAKSGATRTNVTLTGAINGKNKLFTLPNNDAALGYYKILTSAVATITQDGSIYPTPFATASGLASSGISQQIIASGTLGSRVGT